MLQNRRERHHQINGVTVRRGKAALHVADAAATNGVGERIVLARDEQLIELPSHQRLGAISENALGGGVGEFDTPFAVADEEHVRHRADDFARGERRRNGDQVVLAEDDGDDDDEAEQRDVAERIDGDAELRQVIDAAEVGHGEGDEE